MTRQGNSQDWCNSLWHGALIKQILCWIYSTLGSVVPFVMFRCKDGEKRCKDKEEMQRHGRKKHFAAEYQKIRKDAKIGERNIQGQMAATRYPPLLAPSDWTSSHLNTQYSPEKVPHAWCKKYPTRPVILKTLKTAKAKMLPRLLRTRPQQVVHWWTGPSMQCFGGWRAWQSTGREGD